jgi:hypothetical protein
MISLQKERIILTRLVFLFIFLSLTFRFFINTTPSHFLQPSLFLLRFDYTYWAYKLSPIPDVIIQNKTGAYIFDVLLFATCLLSILFPLKRIFIICFGCLFFVYTLSYNMYIVHHAHPLSVMTLITLPFWAAKKENWKLLWEGMRYYICFIYTASFIWKTIYGTSFFFWNNGVNSAKLNLAEYIYHNPGSIISALLRYLISHPACLNIGNIIIVLLEGTMVIGFFTKKFDKYLMLLPVIIHIATYFFSDVFFIEMLVLIFLFFSNRQVETIGKKIPLLAT